jgi:exonuclease III
MDNRPPTLSPTTTSVIVKSDLNSATSAKHTHLSVMDLRQCNVRSAKKDDITNRFSIYHQNISGLKGKISELLLSLPAEAPLLVCLTEHHLKEYELAKTHIPKYKLGANYCRKNLKQGGVCIYVYESIKFSNINLLKYSKEQDIDIAAKELNIQKRRITAICVYRAPFGNFEHFLNKLEIVLNSLHKHNSEMIICGDININYLEPSNKKDQLNSLLSTYNLSNTVFFPTRIVNNSATLIDNIFIDSNRSYTIQSCPNGLSDHDGQSLNLLNLLSPPKIIKPIHIMKVDNNSIIDFQNQLSYEQWDNVFGKNNVNEIFNNFLNTHLRCYYSSFNKKTMKYSNDNNHWITTGIRISCKRKRELFLLCRCNNDVNLKTYYKKYCEVLSNVILSAKKLYYNNLILNFNNNMATTWKIINHENRKPSHDNNIASLKIDNKEITNQNKIANIFNNYFLSIADSLNAGKNNHTNIKESKPISYLINNFHQPFPKMKWHLTSTHEIGKIINL